MSGMQSPPTESMPTSCFSSDAILQLLTATSATAPKHVSQTTLPLLFSSLPDTAPPRTAEAERLKYWTTLSFLGRLCLQADLFETLVVRLSTKLDLICVPQANSEDHEPTGAYAHSILRTLADAFRKKVALGDPDVTKYIDRLVPRLFNLHIYSALVSEGDYLAATDPRLVTVSAEIVTLVVQSTPATWVDPYFSFAIPDRAGAGNKSNLSRDCFPLSSRGRSRMLRRGNRESRKISRSAHLQ